MCTLTSEQKFHLEDINKLRIQRPLIPNPSNLLGIREEHISCSSSFWVQWDNKRLDYSPHLSNKEPHEWAQERGH